MNKNDYKVLGSEEIYEGAIVSVDKCTVQLPNGKEVKWDLVKHNGAAAVIPVDEDGKILMVSQYRLACDDITLEIPAGKLDSGEQPIKCAIRELEEETGYASEDVDFLMKFYTSIGFCNEVIHIYVAKNLKATKQNLDEDEFVNVHRYTVDELIQMIFEGKIIDNKTISAILAYNTKKS